MDRSSGFGSTPNDSYRPVRTRFRCASPTRLSLPLNVSRWPIMQKVRSHPCGLLLFVCMRFQDLFHSPPGVLFTFPSRYCFTIGHQVVFSLGRWSSLLPTRFHVSRGTLNHNSWSSRFTYRTITFYGGTFQFSSVTIASTFMLCPQPRKQVSGLGSFPFARRY